MTRSAGQLLHASVARSSTHVSVTLPWWIASNARRVTAFAVIVVVVTTALNAATGRQHNGNDFLLRCLSRVFPAIPRSSENIIWTYNSHFNSIPNSLVFKSSSNAAQRQSFCPIQAIFYGAFVLPRQIWKALLSGGLFDFPWLIRL